MDAGDVRPAGPPVSGEIAAAAALVAREADLLAEDWRELCRWDPELPPHTEPPVPEPVIAALAVALGRPQPLAWGPDEGLAAAVAAFTERAGPCAIEELVCLREAVSRRLRGRVPRSEVAETWSRLQTTLDRAMACAARGAFAQLEREAFVDPLTGLLNRRAFEIELGRELGRVARQRGRFGLVMIDIDGLKAINDSLGHNAGDLHLQKLAAALGENTRQEDSAYRLGGDEFAMRLPEISVEQAEAVVARIAASAAPVTFSWGMSQCPDDGTTVEQLVEVADGRLYRRRSALRNLEHHARVVVPAVADPGVAPGAQVGGEVGGPEVVEHPAHQQVGGLDALQVRLGERVLVARHQPVGVAEAGPLEGVAHAAGVGEPGLGPAPHQIVLEHAVR